MSEKHCREHHSYDEGRGGNICNPGIECDFCRDKILRAESRKAWGEVKSLRTTLASRDEEVKGLEAQNEQLKYQVCNLLCGEWANGGNHKEGCALRGEDK